MIDLATRLYHACKAGLIPPVWIDDNVIRVTLGSGYVRLSMRQAEKLLRGQALDEILRWKSKKIRRWLGDSSPLPVRGRTRRVA